LKLDDSGAVLRLFQVSAAFFEVLALGDVGRLAASREDAHQDEGAGKVTALQGESHSGTRVIPWIANGPPAPQRPTSVKTPYFQRFLLFLPFRAAYG
jgi:hypothetical protein